MSINSIESTEIKNQIEAIRTQLDTADAVKTPIGHILIALGLLTDLVEYLAEKEATPPAQAEPTYDRYAAARHEYQAERRIDEWAAYHAQEYGQEGEQS